MRALVTGVAGFIGSTRTHAVLARGDQVVGVDCSTPYYDRAAKDANLATAGQSDRFELIETDLRSDDVESLVDGVDVVFHQAAQPGVRLSWSTGFEDYVSHNVLATQRLLEAVKANTSAKFIYASSSSVYGNAPAYPTTEDDVPRPHSPYGVTKLAAEHLCSLYASNFGVPTVSLRYFTVYGPGQRPDMAFNRFIRATLAGEPITVYGTGEQVRDFTYVDDVVQANLLAAEGDVPPGSVFNVSGGSDISVNEVL